MKKETIFIIIGAVLFIWFYISLADFTPKDEQLLDKKGFYFDLYNSQFETFTK